MSNWPLWKSGLKTLTEIMESMKTKLDGGSSMDHMDLLDEIIFLEETAEILIDFASELRRNMDLTVVEFCKDVQNDLDNLPIVDET